MHAIAIEATATIRFSSVWLIFVAFLLPAKTPMPCATRSTGKRADKTSGRKHTCRFQVKVPALIIIYRSQKPEIRNAAKLISLKKGKIAMTLEQYHLAQKTIHHYVNY